MKTFAAIDVGSYALELKIFEISTRNGIKEIDNVCYQLDLGTDSYATGKLGYDGRTVQNPERFRQDHEAV